ncbi:deoxycytidine triphosphate deaminase [Xanthomonas arboricola]|uniref:dCTP deaminase domain-containing protein n=1 Tax=Xanthomonas arboricola TaxID=56448 RepID=UPI000CEE91C7|nr:hypothetical protein [Xanthomonas arboricola]PPU52430.1 hypothetical protein XarbCFBP6827_13275 [Xanthomonas arboricola]
MNSHSVIPTTTVLVHDEILERIRQGQLVTGAADPEKRVRGCSFDLTVGTIFWNGSVLRRTTAEPRQVVVPPGGVVGIFTEESLKLPADIYGTAFAINAMSSKGFLVLNSGHVDPGFEGPLTVKALNVRKTSIAISQGDPIFTVLFTPIGYAAPMFRGNKSTSDREREFNAETVQSSPQTLGEMISVDPNGPFPTRDQVKEMVRNDAVVRLTIGLTLIAAIASVLALFGVSPVGKSSVSKDKIPNEVSQPPAPKLTKSAIREELRKEVKAVESK